MYKTILVPLDGSKRAEAILGHVEELAQRYAARVIFLQVVEPGSCWFSYGNEYRVPRHLYHAWVYHNKNQENA